MNYNPREIEKKWQNLWLDSGEFEPKDDFSMPKKYILSMLPYPSGNLHMGHVRNYTIGDAIARYYRKMGFNVLHPIGWDSFGMPAENAAIKYNLHPKTWTYNNIASMQKVIHALGFSFSKDREFATSDSIYTRWEQEIFNQMWDKGLVYRKKAYLNWCPKDQTTLANEQVIEGRCWRCDTSVVQKEMYQYYFKITNYAESLLSDLEKLEGKWPNQVITMQRNWIGKSSGLEFSFKLERSIGDIVGFKVFTTRPDTIYGVTYCALAPEHDLVNALIAQNLLPSDAIEAINAMKNTRYVDRVSKEKIGINLGIRVLHPLTHEKLEVFVANFVLIEYGHGAVMSVPAHDERDFEFAKKYNLKTKQVIKVPLVDSHENTLDSAFVEDGELINSERFDGLHGQEAREKIIAYFEEHNLGTRITNFKIRDWGISRQRYWGTPIPLVHCEHCGVVKEQNLPVLLPDDVVLDGEGNPLEKHATWKCTKCPKCGANAIRECDTMDTFVESSWYFLRYAVPRKLWESCALDEKSLQYWLHGRSASGEIKHGIDQYIGGIEHAVLHLLYARFFTKVLRDLGYVDIDEPFARLLTQGMVLKDSFKMSKSKGNDVSPLDIIENYGADTARLFILFAAPPVKELEWNDNALEGAYRFISRIFASADKLTHCDMRAIDTKNLDKNAKYARKKVHEALQKYHATFNNPGYPFNTLIAACMEAFNALGAQDNSDVWCEGYYILLHVLEPIIPHASCELSEKLFALENLKNPPKCDEEALKSDTINIAITIAGKKRGEIEVPSDIGNDELLALAREKVAKWLENKTIKKEIIVANRLVNFVLT